MPAPIAALSRLLVICAMLAFSAGRAGALETPLLVFEAGTGEVIKAEAADSLWYPASLTKLMTAYLVFDAIAEGRTSLDAVVTMSAAAAKMPPSRYSGVPGTTFTVQEGLLLLMVKSANDVAYALAEHVGGSHDGFVTQMNRKARLLGMSRSHFVNPHGLHSPDQVTTARDLARLANALVRNHGQYAPLFKVERFELGGKEFVSHNKVLKEYPGADGFKTGYVCSSGWNIIASATRDGRRLMVVTLGNLNASDRTVRATAALDEGFSSWAMGRASIESLPEQGVSIRPVDMRPTVCRKNPQMAVAGPVPSFMASAVASEPAAGDAASGSGEQTVARGAPIPPRRPLSFATMR